MDASQNLSQHARHPCRAQDHMNGGITACFNCQTPNIVSVLRAQPLKYPAKHQSVRNNTNPDVWSLDMCAVLQQAGDIIKQHNEEPEKPPPGNSYTVHWNFKWENLTKTTKATMSTDNHSYSLISQPWRYTMTSHYQ
jgi:hypothetical protein